MNYKWQLQEAKNKFSMLVNAANEFGPQIITKHGKKTAVLISYKEYEKMKKHKTDLVDFFQNSPLAKLGIEFDRNKNYSKEIDL
jgi:prevent-host-death family protein